MPKPRISRFGLPVREDRIIISLTREEKDSIRAEAIVRGLTVTQYLLGLHRKAATLTERKGAKR